MPLENRSFDDPVLVTAVGRYTPAERSGLLAGDIILMFGPHKSAALKEDPDLIHRIGGKDWLVILRGGVYFKLQPRDGLEGATFEASTPLENIAIPVEDQSWFTCHCGMQSSGSILLVPQHISAVWAFVPVLLYTRYRLWQMLTGSVLVYGIAAMMGLVPFILTYVVTALPVITSAAYLVRSASEKQGYARRGDVMVASGRDAAALEVETGRRNRAQRNPQVRPKTEPVLEGSA